MYTLFLVDLERGRTRACGPRATVH